MAATHSNDNDNALPPKIRAIALLMNTFGFPVLVSSALMFGAWTVSNRLVESHSSFLENVDHDNRIQNDILNTVVENQRDIKEILKNQTILMEGISGELKSRGGTK